MEFLRFGSKIAGAYWGCCAIDIIQNFKVDPDAKASIQLLTGDTGGAITHPKGGSAFAGPTYRDIFETRLRIGTFASRDLPNHVFLASMTRTQIRGEVGKKWLTILKENGFEFIRRTNNSVYSYNSGNDVFLFGLFRNIGENAIENPFEPPEEWTSLPEVIPEAWSLLPNEAVEELTTGQQKVHRAQWEKTKTKILSEQDVIDAGAPVWLAGKIGEPPKQKAADYTAPVNPFKDSKEAAAAIVNDTPVTIHVQNFGTF